MKTVKELRTALNMSQQRFEKFTGIPLRTIQNWELGTNSCPSYVLEFLNNQIRPYIEDEMYSYKRYTWMCNSGTEHDMEENIFLTREAALTYMKDYWIHLTEREKKDSHAYIGMCEIGFDDGDMYIDSSNGIYYQTGIEELLQEEREEE